MRLSDLTRTWPTDPTALLVGGRSHRRASARQPGRRRPAGLASPHLGGSCLYSGRNGASSDAPVFISRTKGGFLTTTQVRRLVYAAAAAALSTSGRRRIGSATPTPPTPSSAARPSTWSRPLSAIRRWPPPAATCTLGRPTARRATCRSDGPWSRLSISKGETHQTYPGARTAAGLTRG